MDLTAVLTAAESNGFVDMRVIEGGHDAALPTLRHATTHQFLYLLDGMVAVTVEGTEHRLTAGDCANIPAGTAYATRILSGTARWIASSSGGDGATMWDVAGTETGAFSFALHGDAAADLAQLGDTGVDVALA